MASVEQGRRPRFHLALTEGPAVILRPGRLRCGRCEQPGEPGTTSGNRIGEFTARFRVAHVAAAAQWHARRGCGHRVIGMAIA